MVLCVSVHVQDGLHSVHVWLGRPVHEHAGPRIMGVCARERWVRGSLRQSSQRLNVLHLDSVLATTSKLRTSSKLSTTLH